MNINNENFLDFTPAKFLWKIHHDLISNVRNSINIYKIIKNISIDYISPYISDTYNRLNVIDEIIEEFIAFYRENNVSNLAHNSILLDRNLLRLSFRMIKRLQSSINSDIHTIKLNSNYIINTRTLDDNYMVLLDASDKNIDNIIEITLLLQRWLSINSNNYESI